MAYLPKALKQDDHLLALKKLDSYWSIGHGDDKTNEAIIFRCHSCE